MLTITTHATGNAIVVVTSAVALLLGTKFLT